MMRLPVVVLAVMRACWAAPIPQGTVGPHQAFNHPSQQFHNFDPLVPHSLAPKQSFNPDIHQQSFNHAPQPSFNDFPHQSFSHAPQQSFNDFPQQSFNDAPQQSFKDFPQQSFSHGPQQSFKDFPQQSFNDAPQQSFKDFPQQSFSHGPQQSFKDFPQQSFSHAPQQSFKDFPQQIQKPISQLAFNTVPQHSFQPSPQHSFNPAAKHSFSPAIHQTHDPVSQKVFNPASEKFSTTQTNQPKWTGPVAATVPAGVDGPVVPVSDTPEVAAAKAKFFKAYQAEVAAIEAAKAYQNPAAEGARAASAIRPHSAVPVYSRATPVHSNNNQLIFSTIHAASAPQHGRIHSAPSISHAQHGVPSQVPNTHEVAALKSQFFETPARHGAEALDNYIVYQ